MGLEHIELQRLVELLEVARLGKFNDAHHVKSVLRRKHLVVYGAGAGYIPLENTVLRRFSLVPMAVIDKKYENEKVKNAEGSGPWLIGPKVAATQLNKDEIDVVVSLGKYESYCSVKSELEAMGYNSIVWAPSLFEYNVHHYGHKYDESPEVIYGDHLEIQAAYKMLGDAESRKLFMDLLSIYITHTPIQLNSQPIQNQYFPLDIFQKSDYRTFVNCGAYTGDSIRGMVLSVGKIESLVCIEPDQESFSSLVEYCKKNSELIAAEIQLFPVALGDKDGVVKFQGSKGLCSEVMDGEGDIVVRLVRLDNVLIGKMVDFISMDLEGYEVKALEGAKEIINNCIPNLGISVYHRIPDLWKIMLQIKAMNSDYQFFLRNYTGYAYETILYCKRDLGIA